MLIINIGNRVVNNYLIKTDIGYIAIDTGYAGNFNSYIKGLKNHNIAFTDIKFIFLTHVHDDHVGFLNELITKTNAVVILDYLSPYRLLDGHNQWIGGCSGKFAKLFVNAMGLLGKSEHCFPPVTLPANTIIWDRKSQPLREKGVLIDIISLKGHTADSIGLLTANGCLFCGDAAMNGFPSIYRNIIWIEDLKGYKQSWNTMIKSRATNIYPAHGKPFPASDFIKYKNHLNKIVLR